MTAEQKARDMLERMGVVDSWVSVADRMPAPCESTSGYFWCWSPEDKEPGLLEVFGYVDWNAPGTGFCHEASGTVSGITHWMPANPPKAPDEMSAGDLVELAFDAGMLAERNRCRYPDCLENEDERCPHWLTGECEGPP